MRFKFFILIGLFITLYGCNDDETQLKIEGEYTGTFERNGNTSGVELSLQNGTFSGQSETVKFPAICSGTYMVTNSAITFTNECPWTAEFDWSLILNGEWDYEYDNGTLIMTNSTGDKYILEKQ
ncbi:hypothetical protein OO013_16440 [Mangrovivirga sp. M17]|uniref:META domain-containing protein n=1 Tax=Mangrovivirga halotolerans TaxID=2993936 RepID=A0ABT3RV11_9BACT|nr:hypothetical protein [Mangrovivirga halotolerans]MCX2745470.1 hypothetical protein [Mangrovivirga halotolerans]